MIGIGHWEWGMGHRALGIGHGALNNNDPCADAPLLINHYPKFYFLALLNRS